MFIVPLLQQTETLKLLFSLYFGILKNPSSTPLLPAALHGISKFGHLVNIDFFKDLLQVLKDLISREVTQERDLMNGLPGDALVIGHRLLCIVTAFELLSGQGAPRILFSSTMLMFLCRIGEALNIDLTDFTSGLYAIILQLSLMNDIESVPFSTSGDASSENRPSLADMLFQALDIILSPRTSGSAGPPSRYAAFAKRLLSASLHWPPATVLRTIDFVRGLIAKTPKLEAMLSTEDRIFDGIYRPDVDDPQLCCAFGTCFWELHILQKAHWHAKVREEAGKLLNFSRG